MKLRIVGQGLAGTVLAWEAVSRGIEIELADAEYPVTASRLAAGLVTPISGQRITLFPEIDSLLARMRALYKAAEGVLGQVFYEERPVARVLADATEAAIWEKRFRQAEFREHVTDVPSPLPRGVPAPHGSFTMRQSGLLHVPAFLEASRLYFEKKGCYERSKPADFVVYCLGPWAALEAGWDWLPIVFSQGDILTLAIPDLEESLILSRGGCWLIPLGDGYFRAGSTYITRHKPEAVPSPEGRAFLESRLADLLALPWTVLDHQAAIRPVSPKRCALLGRHPVRHREWVFTGLSSRGVLTAPTDAARLLDHLLHGAPLPKGSDVCEND